jgi:hypothetical protein
MAQSARRSASSSSATAAPKRFSPPRRRCPFVDYLTSSSATAGSLGPPAQGTRDDSNAPSPQTSCPCKGYLRADWNAENQTGSGEPPTGSLSPPPVRGQECHASSPRRSVPDRCYSMPCVGRHGLPSAWIRRARLRTGGTLYPLSAARLAVAASIELCTFILLAATCPTWCWRRRRTDAGHCRRGRW